eukprot:COSAG02_NODE_54_length_43941_cov_54.857990_18_plen_64_part_00
MLGIIECSLGQHVIVCFEHCNAMAPRQSDSTTAQLCLAVILVQTFEHVAQASIRFLVDVMKQA